MAVKIRLSRIGKIHRPYYRIVAIDSRAKRDGKFIENLGTFDPVKKIFVQFHKNEIDKWIRLGAICSDSAKKLIKNYNKLSNQPKAA